MTARSKVTLVEAQQIRSRIRTTILYIDKMDESTVERTIDALLALGLIDTDAALRLVASDG